MKVHKETSLDHGDGDDSDKDPHYVLNDKEKDTIIDDDIIDAEETNEKLYENVPRAERHNNSDDEFVPSSVPGSEGDVEVFSNTQSELLGTNRFYGNSGTIVKKKAPTKKDGPRTQPKTRQMAQAKKVPEKKMFQKKCKAEGKMKQKILKAQKIWRLIVQQ